MHKKLYIIISLYDTAVAITKCSVGHIKRLREIENTFTFLNAWHHLNAQQAVCPESMYHEYTGLEIFKEIDIKKPSPLNLPF